MRGSCWLCGASLTRGMLVSRWAGSGFNGYDRAKFRFTDDSTHVCEACVFTCSRISPVPGRPPKPGKKFGGNFRNYSHAAELRPDGSVDYLNTTKAETAAMVEWIRSAGEHGPWGVALAVSGQKHVIFRAPLNRPGQDMVQIAVEDLVVRCSRAALLGLIHAMNRLRATSGCGVDALLSGRYHAKDLARDLDGVRAFEAERGHERGDGRFEVAALLTSKGAA
jgi:hypothetical protein